MKESAVITYIKNGVEKVITLNNFDVITLKLKLKDIFQIKTYHYSTFSKRIYILKKGVELVIMKNFVFAGTNELIIRGWLDNVLILEDCVIKNNNFLIRFFGYVEMIKPIIVKNKNLNMKFEQSHDTSVILNDNIEGNNLGNINIKASLVQNFNLISNDCLQTLELSHVEFVDLENFKAKSIVYLVGSFSLAGLKLNNSSIVSEESLNFKKLNYLYLRNSNIKAKKSILMKELKEIIIDDDNDCILDNSSYFEVGYALLLGDRVVENKSKDELLYIDGKVLSSELEVSRDHLVRVLNAYKEKILKENEEKLQNFIDENKRKEQVYKKVLETSKIKTL